jgi:hypothetical protein
LIARRKNLTRCIPVGKRISGLFITDEILALVVSAAANLSGPSRAADVDRAGDGRLVFALNTVCRLRPRRNLRIKVNDTVMGRVIQSGRPMMLSGTDLRKVQTSLLVKSILGVPLERRRQSHRRADGR